MKILQLTAENVKRLHVVEITPGGAPVVVIAGDNEAGKSSVLDAIEMALGGKGSLPIEPIRRGAQDAKIVADLGDMIVTRRFTKGGSSLTVTNRDGLKYPSPQALLDGLVGRLSFDPLAFAGMKADEQAATLRQLAQIDTTDLELAHKAAYDERTLINRDLSQATTVLATMPPHPEAGTEPESTTALSARLDAADQLAAQAAADERALALADQATRTAAAAADKADQLVIELQDRLAKAEADEEAAHMALAAAKDDSSAKTAAHRASAARVPDRAALRAQIVAIEGRNQLVAKNQERARLAQRATETKAHADQLTARLAQLETEKAERLARATFPVAGLGLDANGVTWQGLPFEQASMSVRTRVSVAMGLALHPTLRVCLVRNGNDLGKQNLQLLAELAAEHEAQLWVERIAGGDGQTTVVIEDGSVQGVSA